MTTTIEPDTLASRQASANYRANLDALGEQSKSYDAGLPDVEWVFGRDGALTARDDEGRWITGCSVPHRAAQAQLRKLELQGSVGCFLAPPHASAIRVALDRLADRQALIALVPDEAMIRFMLGCEDFSADIRRGRLHVAASTQDVYELLIREQGLTIPTQFVRVSSTPAETIDGLIADAQKVFSRLTAERAELLRHNREKWNRRTDRPSKLCVVVPSSGTIWSDWGRVLGEALNDSNCVRIDPDHPMQSSPLAVSQAALQCDAIVTVNRSRADAPGVIAESMPWITWLTDGRVPDRNLCGVHDRLLVLDEQDRQAALARGWSEREIADAKPQAANTPNWVGDFVSIVAESRSLTPPDTIDEFSSHRVLWEHVAHELTDDPFALNGDAVAFLRSRMQQLGVDERTLVIDRFIELLVVPAYQQGLARILHDAKIPLGTSLNARALVHVWPDQSRLHAIDFAGVPVIRPGRARQEFLEQTRRALAGDLKPATPAGCVISATIVREFLARV